MAQEMAVHLTCNLRVMLYLNVPDKLPDLLIDMDPKWPTICNLQL